jgi:hypothetical protein
MLANSELQIKSAELFVEEALSALHEKYVFTRLIHGAARGADMLAAGWGFKNNIPCMAYPANWERYGKSAGPRRNIQMLVEGKPDMVIAFPGGRGTKHMVEIAKKAKIKVLEIKL